MDYLGGVFLHFMFWGTDLATGTAVMPPPGEGELTGTYHAHCGSQVRDPNGSFWTQRGPIVLSNLSLSTQILLYINVPCKALHLPFIGSIIDTNVHTNMGIIALFWRFMFYLLLTSTWYEWYFLLCEVIYGLSNGFKPLIPLCSWAKRTRYIRITQWRTAVNPNFFIY